jgi:hypothetical protein
MANPRYLRFTVNVPDYFTAAQRKEVGSRVVQEIIKRTQDEHKDKKNKPFAKYSKEYKSSLDFKIAGKNPSEVNLTLSGDMLSDLDVIEHGIGYVDIGYDSGYFGAGKVEGNVIGSYGDSTGHPSKARNFLGMPKTDLNDIISEVESLSESELKQSRTIEQQANTLAKKVAEEATEE